MEVWEALRVWDLFKWDIGAMYGQPGVFDCRALGFQAVRVLGS